MTTLPTPLNKLAPNQQKRLTPEPTPSALEPMLATPAQTPPKDEDWVYERKLDGQRVMGTHTTQHTRLFSRTNRPLNKVYPNIHEALATQAQTACVLDGEIIAFEHGEPSFEALQHRMHRTPSRQQRRNNPVVWILFDVLHIDGYSTRNLEQCTRKHLLPHTIDANPPLKVLDHNKGSGITLIKKACSLGWEGLIAKRASARYEQRRSRAWLKLKCTHQQEFVVGGFTRPMGSRTGFGALLLGYHEEDDFVYVGKVGTGFDEEMLAGLTRVLERIEQDHPPFTMGSPPRAARWVEPRIVVEVLYADRTTGGRLRHARFVGLRPDKDPDEVVWEPIVASGV